MRKKLYLLVWIFLLSLFSACGVKENLTDEKPYPLKSGTYEFQRAVLTNVFTGETEEKTSDDVINAPSEEYAQWRFLFNFSVTVKEDTEFIYTRDNRCVVLKEGFAFELIAEDALQMHLPSWQCNDDLYDIVIVLGLVPRYS